MLFKDSMGKLAELKQHILQRWY